MAAEFINYAMDHGGGGGEGGGERARRRRAGREAANRDRGEDEFEFGGSKGKSQKMASKLDEGQIPGGNSSGVGSMQKTEHEFVSGALDLFDGAPVEANMIDSTERSYFVNGSLTHSGPWTFHVPAEASMLIDPSSFRLSGSLKVVRLNAAQEEQNLQAEVAAAEGRAAVAAEDVTVVNMAPASLFRSVDVDISGQMVSFISTGMAQYKTFLETILSYNKDANTLEPARFRMDTTGQCDTWNNQGALARREWISGSKEMDFNIPLSSDVLRINKYLPDQMSMNITISKTSDAFVLWAPAANNANYRIKITELKLTCRRIQMRREWLSAMRTRLDRGDRLRYPLVRTIIKPLSLSAGDKVRSLHDVFRGRIPNTVIVGFVRHVAQSGSIRANPYHFQNFGVSNVTLVVNSKNYPAQGYRTNFTEGEEKFADAYRGLLDNIGLKEENEEICVGMSEYNTDYTLFAFDLTPDKCGNLHRHLETRGVVNLELQFKQELAEAVSCICYGTYNDEIQIDQDRIAYSTGSVYE